MYLGKQTLLGTVLLSLAGTAVASDWIDRIRAIVPDSIELTMIAESDGRIEIHGRARSNTDISDLMRAIDRERIGRPNLQEIRLGGNVSEFSLLVEPR